MYVSILFLYDFRRIQAQAEQLDREYKAHALCSLKSAPLRGMGKVNKAITYMYIFMYSLVFFKNPFVGSFEPN